MHVWLDDIRDPTQRGYQLSHGARGDEIWVKTVPEALALLQKGGVESISLDNDLGEDQELEGRWLAAWIEEQAFHGTLDPIDVFVHSDNVAANKEMRYAIANAKHFWSRT